MAYAFEQGESVRAAIGRILDELLVRARAQLLDPRLTSEERVHEARKRFKEIRAVIRLVREPLGELYRAENAFFRDAGRALARQQEPVDVDALIARTVQQLDLARTRIARWPPLEDSFETLALGLADAYRGGRRGMRDADSDAEIHEWRKLAKRHWYHVQLLRNVAPPTFEPYAAILHDLSGHLGDHHDLHMIRERLPGAGEELLDAIAKGQKDAESEARAIGANVYAAKPKEWLARMREQWNAWR